MCHLLSLRPIASLNKFCHWPIPLKQVGQRKEEMIDQYVLELQLIARFGKQQKFKRTIK